MIQPTWDDQVEATAALEPMSVIDLGSRFGWGWRCECGHGHVEEYAQEGGLMTCDKCGKEYCCV